MINDYLLMRGNIPVVEFNTYTKTTKVIRPTLIPFGQSNSQGWDIIQSFCADRILHLNRQYCKEILAACNIDNQTDINICLIGKGLSFYDNYWITNKDFPDKWENVNLYKNIFSSRISYTALTGELKSIQIEDKLHLGHTLTELTGELTARGTRPKCFYRQNDDILLIKRENIDEIDNELLSYSIASFFKLPSTQYNLISVNNITCSCCTIGTSFNKEIIHCREVLNHYNLFNIDMDNEAYQLFIKQDSLNFIKMQLFDIFTLNIDRNRDNFALEVKNGQIKGLYPIYDHDSCFKEENLNAHYFVTNKTFYETLYELIEKYPQDIIHIYPDIINLYTYINTKGFKNRFLQLKTLNQYDNFVNRVDFVIKVIDNQKINNQLFIKS